MGLLCRELLRSLADETFEEALVPQGGVVPGPADAVARLEYVVDTYAAGSASREIRKIVKAHLDLANAVQHDREATLLDATVVAEASITTVNLVRALVVGPGEIADEQSPDRGQHAIAAAQMYSMLLDSEAVDAIKDIGGIPTPSLVIVNEIFDDFATNVVGKPWKVSDNLDFFISSSGEIAGYKYRSCAADYARLRDDPLAIMAEAGLTMEDLEALHRAGRRPGEVLGEQEA